MNGDEFVMELYMETLGFLARLERLELVEAESDNRLEMSHLLRIALRNELEAAELAAGWVTSTPEIDVKLGFARQAGDEARHYKLIEKLLLRRHEDLSTFNPLAGGNSKLFNYLVSLPDTVSRLAAGQFTREAIAVKRNEQFIRLCQMRGDAETATLYRDTIQPDESYHHELGRSMLAKYALTEDQRSSALTAARRTLELAEELRGLAAQRTGVCQIPGC